MTILGGARKGYVKLPPTARDYVQDGLMVHLDSLENGGYDVKDDQLRCVNLVGDGQLALRSISANGFVGNGRITIDGIGSILDRVGTIDISFRFSNYLGDLYKAYQVQCINTSYSACLLKVAYTSSGSTRAIFSCYGTYDDRINIPSQDFPINYSVAQTTSASANRTKIYIGGSLVRTSSRYYVGGNYSLSDNLVMNESRISIRRILIYSRELTAEEIAHNYAIDKVRFGI